MSYNFLNEPYSGHFAVFTSYVLIGCNVPMYIYMYIGKNIYIYVKMPKITQIIYCRLLEGPNLLKFGLMGLLIKA